MSMMWGYVHLQMSSSFIVANVKRANWTTFVKTRLLKRLLQDARVILRAIGSKHSSGLACDMIMRASKRMYTCSDVISATCKSHMRDVHRCITMPWHLRDFWKMVDLLSPLHVVQVLVGKHKCQGSQVKASPAAQYDWPYKQFALFMLRRSLPDGPKFQLYNFMWIWKECINTLTWVKMLLLYNNFIVIQLSKSKSSKSSLLK